MADPNEHQHAARGGKKAKPDHATFLKKFLPKTELPQKIRPVTLVPVSPEFGLQTVPPLGFKRPRPGPPIRRFGGPLAVAPRGAPVVHPAAPPPRVVHPAAPPPRVVPVHQPTVGDGPTYPKSTYKPHGPAPHPGDEKRAPAAPAPVVDLPPVPEAQRKPITAPTPVGDPAVFSGKDGRTVSAKNTSNGRYQLECPPAPLRELTFSGGGGKGNVYPGVVDALERDGALAQVKELRGASAGSITAALLSSGMSAEAFKTFSDTHDFKAAISDGSSLGKLPFIGKQPINSDGNTLQDMVATGMRDSLAKKLGAYLQSEKGKSDTALAEIQKRLGAGKGPTFKDLRLISAAIPSVKEVVIDATKNADDPSQPMQSTILSADSSPDMEVADAVHASAALPGAFSPKSLTTADGKTDLYRDGGLLNNAPSTDTVGGKRNVETVASSSNLTFVFEGDAQAILNDQVKPARIGTFDEAPTWKDAVAGAVSGFPSLPGLAGAGYEKAREAEIALKKKYASKIVEFNAAQYNVSKILAKHRDAVVEVPLKYTRGRKTVDNTGLFGGTINFNMKKEQKDTLRGMASENTDEKLQQMMKPRTLTFDSRDQALNSVPLDVLTTMSEGGDGEAKKTIAFREATGKHVARLEALAAVSPADPGAVKQEFAELDKLTEGNKERVTYVGLQMNRSGKLDALLKQMRGDKGRTWFGHGVVVAGQDINDQFEAEALAAEVDTQALQPLIVTTAETPAGTAEVQMLTATEAYIRPAERTGMSYTRIRDGLAVAVKHYLQFPYQRKPTELIDRAPYLKVLNASFHKAGQLASEER